eukprot:2093352-Prymnesium_polylepis.1
MSRTLTRSRHEMSSGTGACRQPPTAAAGPTCALRTRARCCVASTSLSSATSRPVCGSLRSSTSSMARRALRRWPTATRFTRRERTTPAPGTLLGWRAAATTSAAGHTSRSRRRASCDGTAGAPARCTTSHSTTRRRPKRGGAAAPHAT